MCGAKVHTTRGQLLHVNHSMRAAQAKPKPSTPSEIAIRSLSSSFSCIHKTQGRVSGGDAHTTAYCKPCCASGDGGRTAMHAPGSDMEEG